MNTFKNTNVIIEKIDMAVLVETQKDHPARYFKNRKYHGLVYQLSGCVAYFMHGEEHIVKPKSLLYLPKGYDYRVESLESGQCIAINFATVNELDMMCKVYDFDNYSIFNELFVKTNKEWLYKKGAYIPKCLSFLYEIIYLITQNLMKAYYPQEKSTRLQPAISFIENNYSDYSLRVSKLAESVNMSVSNFRKCFKEVYNFSPIQYINNLRINHAQDLLLSGFYSIGRIAELSGYSNVYYFSKSFKQKIGMSPREYREKYIL